MFYFRYERKIRGQERETWETLETWCSNEQHKSQYVAALLFVFIRLTQFWFQSFRPWPCINQFFCVAWCLGPGYQFQKMMVPWRTVKYIKEWPWFSTLFFIFFILELFFNIQNKTKFPVLKCTENLYSNIFLCVFKSLLHRMTAANYRYAKNKMTCLPDFYFFVPGKIINFINLFA